MKKILLMVLFLLLICGTCYAETKEIIAEGTYNMGDNDTPVTAENGALMNAKRSAIEQAGTYIESYSQTNNFQLTKDEVTTLATGVIQTIILDKGKTTNQDGNITFWVKVKCLINNDNLKKQLEDQSKWQLVYTLKMNWPVPNSLTGYYYDKSTVIYNEKYHYIECWIKSVSSRNYSSYEHVRFDSDNFCQYLLFEEKHYKPNGKMYLKKIFDNPDWKTIPQGTPFQITFYNIYNSILSPQNAPKLEE